MTETGMTETGAWAGSATRRVAPRAQRPAGRGAAGWWALLRAQSQLEGKADAFALAEDDRWRLGAGRDAAVPLTDRYR
jgi:hypothetical protein